MREFKIFILHYMNKKQEDKMERFVTESATVRSVDIRQKPKLETLNTI